MHKYLRSVGFGAVRTKEEEKRLLKSMEMCPPWGGPGRERHENRYAEIKCSLGDDFGVILHGYRGENGAFEREYYFPYMKGLEMLPIENASIRRHTATESYAVLFEDYRMGSSLIFYLTNGLEFREREETRRSTLLRGAYLTGMAEEGSILLPIAKSDRQRQKLKALDQSHNQMLEAAWEGDETAIENLTMNEINLYGQVSRRAMKEDIYSIVESTFMPSGVECDSYTVLGEILKCDRVTNLWTREDIWRMQLECNGMNLTVCIGAADLLGEPQVGRRFKGDIWLQGYGVFAD